MAIVNGYATVEQLQRALRRTVDNADPNLSWLEMCIEQSSRFIDAQTGSFFYEKTLSNEKIDIYDMSDNEVMIDSTGDRLLFPAPLTEVTSIVESSSTLTEDIDFFTYKSMGVIERDSGWSSNRKAIVFTGKIGYASTPTRIVALCLQIAKAISGLSVSAFTDESGGLTEVIRESIPKWVLTALKKERRIVAWG